MSSSHNPYRRFGRSLHARASFRPGLNNAPPLPVVDYAAVGRAAPALAAAAGSGTLPQAAAIVITWADAEWAALQHVFCAGASPMPYADRARGGWTGWRKYAQGLPGGAPADWSFWGEYRLVQIAAKPVLLFKSNTHLDFPGQTYLEALIALLIREVGPSLILSIGTAGGARTTDHVGTVRAVSAGTLYQAGQPQADWPVYGNAWRADDTLLTSPDLAKLLFAIPTTPADLATLRSSFNKAFGTGYTLAQLDPDGLNSGDPVPQLVDQTGGAASLLTTAGFVVGTTAGDFASYSAIEEDDAVIGHACAASGTAFGFVRNISDPVQNAALPTAAQGNWGSAVYDAYGLYTSYNGAVAAWAILAA